MIIPRRKGSPWTADRSLSSPYCEEIDIRVNQRMYIYNYGDSVGQGARKRGVGQYQ